MGFAAADEEKKMEAQDGVAYKVAVVSAGAPYQAAFCGYKAAISLTGLVGARTRAESRGHCGSRS